MHYVVSDIASLVFIHFNNEMDYQKIKTIPITKQEGKNSLPAFLYAFLRAKLILDILSNEL